MMFFLPYFAIAQWKMPEITFGNAKWINVAIAVGVAFILFTLLTYVRSARSRSIPLGLRIVAIGMRIVGIAFLLACLLDPMGTLQRPKPQANIFAIAVDTSQSMNVISESENSPLASTSNSSSLKNLLADESTWARKLADDFRVRKYFFSNTLDATDSFQNMDNAGTLSSLYYSLQSIHERYDNQPLAGLLLVTDGRATDDQPPEWVRQLGYPIYPVRLTGPKSLEDIRISSVSTRQSDFEAAPVTMQASISHNGYDGEKVVVNLINSDKEVQESKEVTLNNGESLTSVEFQFRPSKSGVQGYQITARRASEVKVEADLVLENPNGKTKVTSADSANVGSTVDPIAVSTNSRSTEATLGNNARFQVVDRGKGPYKILYFSGRPNWDFKFLRRALSEDDEIQLTALIRIANKQPKFNFRESKVDSSNPLFSGFEDISEDEKQKYDEPVFVRLGVTESEQLKRGFPKTAEELFDYSAIILDDLETEFLSQADQSLIRQFVTVRGGALLMMGGTEAMRGKSFRDSVLSQMLPFYSDDALRSKEMENVSSSAAKKSSDVLRSEASSPYDADQGPAIRYQLTREGWLHPFLRLSDNENGEKERLQSMPPFEVITRIPKIKPGGSVLVEATATSEETLPVLVTQWFGKGRTSVLSIGDMWRWALHDKRDDFGTREKEVSPLAQSWRQMIRWMISDVPNPIEMSLVDSQSNRKSFRLQVSVKDTDFEVVDNAKVQLSIDLPSGKNIVCRAEPSSESLGVYEATIVGDLEGVYSAKAEATSSNGKDLGSSQIGWVYEPLASEFQSIGEDLARLETIAKESGGEVIDAQDLDQFVASLPSRKAPIVETRIYQIWHQSWVLGLAVLCLSIEWGIRRRYGMA